MTLKLPTNIQTLDEVDATLHGLYIEDKAAGGFTFRGVDGLINAVRSEKERRLYATGRVKQLESQVAVLSNRKQSAEEPSNNPSLEPDAVSPREKFIRENAHRLSGLDDEARNAMIATILDEAAPLIDAEVREYVASQESRLNVVRDNVRRLTIESEARKILADVAVRGSENTLLPHVLKRLTASENEGGEFQLSVVDVDGKPMSMSIEDLKDEFRHTPAFAPVVRGADSSEQVSHARKVALALGEPPQSMKAH